MLSLSCAARRPGRARASRRDRVIMALPSLAALLMMAIPQTETSPCFVSPVNSWGATRGRTNACMDQRCSRGVPERGSAVFGSRPSLRRAALGMGRRGAVGVGMVSPMETGDVTSMLLRRLVNSAEALLSAP